MYQLAGQIKTRGQSRLSFNFAFNESDGPTRTQIYTPPMVSKGKVTLGQEFESHYIGPNKETIKRKLYLFINGEWWY